MSFIEFNKKQSIRSAVIYPEIYGAVCSLSPEARLEEAKGLALAINLDVVHGEIVKVRSAKPATLVGQGVLDRLLSYIAEK